MLTRQRKSATATATLGIGATLVAIACCAGLPAIGALLGGVTPTLSSGSASAA